MDTFLPAPQRLSSTPTPGPSGTVFSRYMSVDGKLGSPFTRSGKPGLQQSGEPPWGNGLLLFP